MNGAVFPALWFCQGGRGTEGSEPSSGLLWLAESIRWMAATFVSTKLQKFVIFGSCTEAEIKGRNEDTLRIDHSPPWAELKESSVARKGKRTRDDPTKYLGHETPYLQKCWKIRLVRPCCWKIQCSDELEMRSHLTFIFLPLVERD